MYAGVPTLRMTKDEQFCDIFMQNQQTLVMIICKGVMKDESQVFGLSTFTVISDI